MIQKLLGRLARTNWNCPCCEKRDQRDALKRAWKRRERNQWTKEWKEEVND